MSTAALLGLLGVLSGVTPAAPESSPLCIVSSQVNQQLMEEQQFDYRRGIRAWMSAAVSLSRTYRIVGDHELASGIGDCAVLVLHHTVRLSDAQLESIERYYADGGNLLLVGMPGRFNEAGAPRQQSLPERWLGITNPRPFNPKETQSSFFVIRSASPLHLSADPGQRLELDWVGPFWVADSDEPGAFFSDWLLFPVTEKNLKRSAAMVFRQMDYARVTWLGFSPEYMLQTPNQDKQAERIARDVLAWTSAMPMIGRAWWPNGHPAAAVVTGNLDEQPENGLRVAELFSQLGIKGSFFVPGSLAQTDPQVATALAQAGSVGAHGMTLSSFKDLPLGQQKEEIQRARDALLKAGLNQVQGFRPPMEEYNDDTLRAAAQTGMGWFFGNVSFDRAWPRKLKSEGAVLYQFARIVADDFSGPETGTGDAFVGDFVGEAGRMIDVGGIVPLSFQTAFLGMTDASDRLAVLVGWLKEHNIWITTFPDIVNWIEDRSLVLLAASPGRASIEFTISNQGTHTLDNFPLLYLPPLPSAKAPELIRSPGGVTVGDKVGDGYVILVSLAPHESKKVLLR